MNLSQLDDFEAFFEGHKNLVFRVAYLMMGDRGQAEDVMQEVFVAAWKSSGSFNPDKGKLKSWLYRITVNKCISTQRRKKVEMVWEVVESPSEPAEDTLLKREEREVVMQAVNSLDEKHHAVLVLRYFDDLSYGEIARALSIPLGTVKSRMNKALEMLRQGMNCKDEEVSYEV